MNIKYNIDEQQQNKELKDKKKKKKPSCKQQKRTNRKNIYLKWLYESKLCYFKIVWAVRKQYVSDITRHRQSKKYNKNVVFPINEGHDNTARKYKDIYLEN
jgi:hypothetical protein